MNKQPNNKPILGKMFIIIGIFLIIASITMFINNQYKEINAGKKSEIALDIIKNNLEQINENDTNNENILNNINNQENISTEKNMKTTNINGYDYIGTLTIPTLNLELPIMSEYDYNRLEIAPCRYYGSIYTNDLIICAHSYKTHFKYLNKLKQKDLIIFTDIEGNNYIYEVLETEILNPKQVSEMINNDFDLTLYTCTNDGQNRITIRCNQIYKSI